MRKIQPSIVLVKSVSSPKSRDEFSEVQLTEAAQLILAGEGVINPPILLKTGMDPHTGLESYTVVDGHFEYYSAMLAREINARKGETINAYVIEAEEDETLFREQIRMFRDSGRATTAPVVTSSENAEVMRSLNGISRQLANVPSQVKDLITIELNRQVSGLSKEINEIAKQYSEIRLLMEEVKKGGKGIVGRPAGSQKITKPKLSPEVKEKIKGLPYLEFINALNTLESDALEMKLRMAKASKTVIDSILAKKREQPFQEFTSYLDVMERVDGLGGRGAKMLELLRRWSEVFP
jgi:hypothetical protein